jgi:hypothetical protein
MNRFLGKFDSHRAELAGHACEVNGLIDGPDGLVCSEIDGSRKTPRTVVEDSNGKADFFTVVAALQFAVMKGQILRANPLEPEIGVLGTKVAGSLKSRVSQRTHGKSHKRGVDLGWHD